MWPFIVLLCNIVARACTALIVYKLIIIIVLLAT